MWNLICSVFLFSPNVIPHWGLAPNVGSHWLHVANMESNIFRFFSSANVESHWGLAPNVTSHCCCLFLSMFRLENTTHVLLFVLRIYRLLLCVQFFFGSHCCCISRIYPANAGLCDNVALRPVPLKPLCNL